MTNRHKMIVLFTIRFFICYPALTLLKVERSRRIKGERKNGPHAEKLGRDQLTREKVRPRPSIFRRGLFLSSVKFKGKSRSFSNSIFHVAQKGCTCS